MTKLSLDQITKFFQLERQVFDNEKIMRLDYYKSGKINLLKIVSKDEKLVNYLGLQANYSTLILS